MSRRIALIEAPGAAPRLDAAADAPPPGPGEVTLRLHAAALNFADLLMAEGRYQETPPFPFVPGLEGAGTVLAAGPGVGLAPGTRCAVCASGTLAETATFDAARVLPIPDGVPFEEAAGFQIAYGTSHLALTARAGLGAGETLVVLGAGGGVGLTAVEIGAALGARVVAVARGEGKLEAAGAAGAAELIDSDATPDLKAALKALGGADVVYDPVGDAPGLAAFAALRAGGRFLVIGFAGGRPPALPLNHALVKNIAIHGFYWGGMRETEPGAVEASLQALFAMRAEGRLQPHPGTVLPFERLDEAYALLRERRAIGKVILKL